MTLGPDAGRTDRTPCSSVFEILVQGEPQTPPVFPPLAGLWRGRHHREAAGGSRGAGAERRSLAASTSVAPGLCFGLGGRQFRGGREGGATGCGGGALCRPKLALAARSRCASCRWRRRSLPAEFDPAGRARLGQLGQAVLVAQKGRRWPAKDHARHRTRGGACSPRARGSSPMRRKSAGPGWWRSPSAAAAGKGCGGTTFMLYEVARGRALGLRGDAAAGRARGRRGGDRRRNGRADRGRRQAAGGAAAAPAGGHRLPGGQRHPGAAGLFLAPPLQPERRGARPFPGGSLRPCRRDRPAAGGRDQPGRSLDLPALARREPSRGRGPRRRLGGSRKAPNPQTAALLLQLRCRRRRRARRHGDLGEIPPPCRRSTAPCCTREIFTLAFFRPPGPRLSRWRCRPGRPCGRPPSTASRPGRSSAATAPATLPILPEPGAAAHGRGGGGARTGDLPRGASQLRSSWPGVAAPVLDHRWRLVLPDA